MRTVLDLIPEQTIETWKPGDHVMIVAGTGKCKTTWVKQVLWPYCKKHGLSLYTLANRSMLRDDIKQGTDMPVLTYQFLEQFEHRNHPAWSADVVVLDECHSLASDIELDYRRDKIRLLFENKHTIVIGLTATPIDCVSNLFDKEHIYSLPRNCSNIESVVVYYRAADTKAIIQRESANGGRVLCFVRSSRKGKQMQAEINASSFICSKNAAQWDQDIEHHKKAISSDRNWGDNQVLITTKVLDNGVSIEDEDVNAILVETDDYSVDLIQMIGRIRCQKGQRIRLYIRLYSRKYFEKLRDYYDKELQEAKDHVSEPDHSRYEFKANRSLILADGSFNELCVAYFEQRVNDINRILTLGVERIISQQLCDLPVLYLNRLQKKATSNMRNSLPCDIFESTLGLIKTIEGRHYTNKDELFHQFAEFVRITFKGRDHHNKPKACRRNINLALERLGVGYHIVQKQYGKGPERGRYYYAVEKLS